jgi:hypothetical protein
MAQAPAQSFGIRRMPPAPLRPGLQPVVSVALQAASRYFRLSMRYFRDSRQYFRRSRQYFWDHCARVPGLLQANAQILAPLPAFLLNALKCAALAVKPRPARLHKAAIRAALLRSDASAIFVRVLSYIGALAGLAATAAYFVHAAPATVASDPAPPVEWLYVAKPYPAFSLPLSELAESGHEYAMRRHVSGGGRQDILTWGELEGTSSHLLVEIYRPVAERTGFEAPEHEIAARVEGIDAGSIKPAGEMETKFGAVSLVEFSTKSERQCLGFVRAYDNPQLQILGWHCISGAAPVERELAACALDRLALVAAASEPKLRELFARAELKRNFCGQRSHLYTPTPKHAWSGEVATGSPTKTMRN